MPCAISGVRFSDRIDAVKLPSRKCNGLTVTVPHRQRHGPFIYLTKYVPDRGSARQYLKRDRQSSLPRTRNFPGTRSKSGPIRRKGDGDHARGHFILHRIPASIPM
jgi:hypothetical protein